MQQQLELQPQGPCAWAPAIGDTGLQGQVLGSLSLAAGGIRTARVRVYVQNTVCVQNRVVSAEGSSC